MVARSDGAAVGPLAGARVRPRMNALPSTGLAVVLEPERRRGGPERRLCSFPHGVERLPAVVAQQVCPTALSWLGFVILSVDPIRIEIFLSSSFHSDFFTQNSIYSLDRLTDTIVRLFRSTR